VRLTPRTTSRPSPPSRLASQHAPEELLRITSSSGRPFGQPAISGGVRLAQPTGAKPSRSGAQPASAARLAAASPAGGSAHDTAGMAGASRAAAAPRAAASAGGGDGAPTSVAQRTARPGPREWWSAQPAALVEAARDGEPPRGSAGAAAAPLARAAPPSGLAGAAGAAGVTVLCVTVHPADVTDLHYWPPMAAASSVRLGWTDGAAVADAQAERSPARRAAWLGSRDGAPRLSTVTVAIIELAAAGDAPDLLGVTAACYAAWPPSAAQQRQPAAAAEAARLIAAAPRADGAPLRKDDKQNIEKETFCSGGAPPLPLRATSPTQKASQRSSLSRHLTHPEGLPKKFMQVKQFNKT
jgi:hypothetical protein